MGRARWVLLILAALILMSTMAGCGSTPGAGEIGVIRNGKAWYNPFDWFDNHNIRGIVKNGSGYAWVGMGSDVHYYPVDTQQRYFRAESKICNTDNPNAEDAYDQADGADGKAITVPTSDGVDVTICGTTYLNTVFNDSQLGLASLKAFDTQFSTRTFGGLHPYDGAEGWSHLLGDIVEPIIANNARDIISGITCSELVSSCALIQNGATGTKAFTSQNKNNQSNVKKVQDLINAGLASDLRDTLGRAYFKRIQFRLKVVKLPLKVQGAVEDAQAAFGRVSQSAANVKAATQDALANEKRQHGFESCRPCAQRYVLEGIPKSITTFAPGQNFSVTP